MTHKLDPINTSSFQKLLLFYKTPLGALRRNCLRQRNPGFDQNCFPLHLSLDAAGSVLSQQTDTVISDSRKNHAEILLLSALHCWSEALLPRTAGLQVLTS